MTTFEGRRLRRGEGFDEEATGSSAVALRREQDVDHLAELVDCQEDGTGLEGRREQRLMPPLSLKPAPSVADATVPVQVDKAVDALLTRAA